MENESRIRRHRTPAERAKILEQYHQSGLTQEAFAAQAGISCSALSSWLRRAAANSHSQQPQFLSVPNLLATGRGSAVYRLQWPDGFTLEVVAGFAASELGVLLQVVRRL
jgi:lambda repressor-like predicted transcriptional regulator